MAGTPQSLFAEYRVRYLQISNMTATEFASLPNFSATLNEEKMAYLASPQYDIFSIGICLRDVPLFIESSKVIE